MASSRRLLIVDSGWASASVAAMLGRRGGERFETSVASSIAEGARLVQTQEWDCVLVWTEVADVGALAGLTERGRFLVRPPIVVIGADDEEAARAAIRDGAQEHLGRSELSERALRRAIHFAIERRNVRLTDGGLRDPLTGLANRVLFMDRLARALARLDRERFEVAVAFIDVDAFKSINDRFGHAAGDEALVAVARRLEAVFRGSDTIARLAGDEMAMIWDGRLLRLHLSAIASRLANAFAAPVTVGGRPLSVTASAGIATATTQETDAASLLARADAAMYRAKERGPGGRSCRVEMAPEPSPPTNAGRGPETATTRREPAGPPSATARPPQSPSSVS